MNREHFSLLENSVMTNTPEQKQIISDLTSISELKSTEIIIYLVLLKHGPMFASKLTKKLNLGRVSTYQYLDRLKKFGFVTVTLSNPAYYEAVEPSQAFSILLQKKTNESVMIKKITKNIKTIFEDFGNASQKHDMPKFNIINGKSRIYSYISNVIEQASGIVYVITTHNDLMRMYYTSIPEKIKIAKKNQNKIRIITDKIPDESFPILKKLNASEIGICRLPSQGRIILEQNKILLISNLSDGEYIQHENENMIFTNSNVMINSLHALSEMLWSNSEIICRDGKN